MDRLPSRLSWLLVIISESIEKNWLWCIAAFSCIYWSATWHAASTKPLWNDEILTHYLATLPSWTDLWHALLNGGDQQTPLFYAVTRFTGAGGQPWGLRL